MVALFEWAQQACLHGKDAGVPGPAEAPWFAKSGRTAESGER